MDATQNRTAFPPPPKGGGFHAEDTVSYSDLLLDPRWQKKRLEILVSAGWKCEACRSGKKTLHVHHLFYRPRAKPWEYPAIELQALCEDCHGLSTDEQNRFNGTVREWLLRGNSLQDLVVHMEGEMAAEARSIEEFCASTRA
jgi:hypothetical protein